jgi:hypothetical protein
MARVSSRCCVAIFARTQRAALWEKNSRERRITRRFYFSSTRDTFTWTPLQHFIAQFGDGAAQLFKRQTDRHFICALLFAARSAAVKANSLNAPPSIQIASFCQWLLATLVNNNI